MSLADACIVRMAEIYEQHVAADKRTADSPAMPSTTCRGKSNVEHARSF
jgi:hypothetical protein